MFSNVPEANQGTTEDSEAKLRTYQNKVKIARDLPDKIAFERVHRMGPRIEGRPRKPVAKFTLFKERDLVRRK